MSMLLSLCLVTSEFPSLDISDTSACLSASCSESASRALIFTNVISGSSLSSAALTKSGDELHVSDTLCAF